jgi:hypothetical protein
MTRYAIWTPHRPRCFFMHIPKTAGMALRLFLGNQYQVSQIMPANDWRELLELDIREIAKYCLFQGHFSCGIFDLLPKDIRSIVFLREPVARTISHLRHLRRDPNFHPAHSLVAGRSLDELVRDDRIMDLCCNIQTSQLSNDIPGETILRGLRSEQENGLIPDLDAYVLEPDLAKAQHTLERFDFVGFVESLQEDILLLSMALGLHPPAVLPKSNDDPEGEIDIAGLQPGTLAILRERNALDIALYDAARRRPRLTRRGVGAALRERGFYAPISQPTEFPMSGSVPGANWHECEEEDGRTYRWTGPLHETLLDLPLAPGLRFEVSLSVMIANLDDLSVAAGGIELPLRCDWSEGAEHRVSFWVGAEAVEAGGLTTLCFRTRKVFRASDTDVRMVSFLVTELSVSTVKPALPEQTAGDNFNEERSPGEPPPSIAGFDPHSGKLESVDLPLDGASSVLLLGKPTGFFRDGWMRAHAAFRCQASDRITSMSLQMWAPPGDKPLTLTLKVPGENDVTVSVPLERVCAVRFSLNAAPAAEFQVELVANRERRLSDTDGRHAAYVLNSISFS